MPQLTGTLLDGGGNGLSTLITFDTIGDPLSVSGGAVRPKARVTATSSTSGTFTATLAGGAWRMRWQSGALISEVVLTMPPSGGPYTLANLMFYQAAPVSTPQQAVWFADIAEMLATPTTEWREGRTRNSYGTDGVVSGWNLLLKTDAAAAGLSDNGDSILETDDTLGFALRTWIAS